MFASSMVASVRSTRREAFTAEAATSRVRDGEPRVGVVVGWRGVGERAKEEERAVADEVEVAIRRHLPHGLVHDFAKTSRHRGSSAADARCLDDADADKIDAGSKRENTSESVAASTSSMPVETPTRGAAALDILARTRAGDGRARGRLRPHGQTATTATTATGASVSSGRESRTRICEDELSIRGARESSDDDDESTTMRCV